MACSTLGDGPVEETRCARHREQRSDAHAASRLAKDGDVLRITTEGSDILLHPDEGRDLVEQAEVGALVTQVEEAVHAETVVDGHADHSVAGEATAIIIGYGTRPVRKSTAMNPDHDGQPDPAEVRGPDIEVQAVLAFDDWLREKGVERRKIRRFWHRRAITERFAHAIPWLGWARRLKTIGAERRGRIGDPFEGSHSFNHAPPNHTLPGPDICVHCASPSLDRNIGGRETLQEVYHLGRGPEAFRYERLGNKMYEEKLQGEEESHIAT